MSEALGLGKIITTPQGRDAVHIAVVPMVAATSLKPGDKVAVEDNMAWMCLPGGHIGVVDPYLKETVRKGETFWLFLNPGSITSLRHDWTHPALPTQDDKVAILQAKTILETGADSHAWLESLAAKHGMSYKELVEACDECLREGHFTFGFDTPDDFSDDEMKEQIFMHLEAVSGRRWDEATKKNAYFGCSC